MDQRPLDDFVARARELRRQEELDSATVAVFEAFDSQGIDALLLKGPALARRLYTADENRGYWDVDLLISSTDLAPAGDVLAGLGYTRAQEVLGIDDVAGILHAEVWARKAEDGGPLVIDLHYRLSRCEAPAEVLWQALSTGRDSIELQERQVPILGKDGLAMHLAIHAAQHGLDDTKAIADLERGVERWPLEVWRSAARLATAVGGEAPFAAGLRLIPAGSRLAGDLDLQPAPELEWEIEHREGRPRGTFHVAAIGQARGARERLNVLRRSLFPSPEWIRFEFPWARSRPRLIVAYLCHLLRAPIWAARALRFRRRRDRGRGA